MLTFLTNSWKARFSFIESGAKRSGNRPEEINEFKTYRPYDQDPQTNLFGPKIVFKCRKTLMIILLMKDWGKIVNPLM